MNVCTTYTIEPKPVSNISLCTFVKNEQECIAGMIGSVQQYVDELVLVDTGSTDLTVHRAHEICQSFNLPIRAYRGEFTNFGEVRTKTAHLASKEWVLMLDADERLSKPEMLQDVIKMGGDAFAFPRRRWLDRKMEKQTELEAYPDWQVRLFKNNKEYVWKRELHEYFHGAAVDNIKRGPTIEHFHDVYKSPERLAERKALYEKLAKKAGVTVEGGHVL
jgi:glycosyltransferase involved in cell wall biosynthesis